MRKIIAAWLVAVPMVASALPQQAPQQAQQPEPAVRDLSLPPPLSDELIRQAVRAVVIEDPHPVDPATRTAGAFGTTSPTVRDKMSAAFEQAKVPDCLHEDALKLQPAYIGPIAVVGPYSLPWVISAIIRGKCH
ncbi:hypothetical protein Jab_2c14650 [Janthinobacterium sp. HH01]|uniref:hypothetical protein n=1 Tax=Janthinobacterium sp. HH01 TaxID=1198452 RepID=UPI0002AE8E3D|nr:hypothetical protein [Janthinobacterium sp. HH01]ELX09399.1 hypothetical protein Jab_2c14650 [Janthinobacterium sp. HH01]